MTQQIKYLIGFFTCLIAISGVLAQADETLWYTKPASKWTEALPLGNGRLGAMVFGGVAQDHVQFNEETLWTGGPRNYNQKGAYKYLDTIRQLLFAGKQKEAEAIAGKHFMGLKSKEEDRENWIALMKSLKGVKGNPTEEKYDDSKWGRMWVPSFDGWEVVGHEGLDGAVWMRTTFDVPASLAGKKLNLDLNRIRNWDATYINGKLIGSMYSDEPRKYEVPAGLLHAGENVIAVQVLNFDGRGGIGGFKDTTRHIGLFADASTVPAISLNGAWKYFVQNDEPPEVGAYQASYQPFGDLWLKFPHQYVQNYKRSLQLNNAISTTAYEYNGVQFTRSYFASAVHQTMVVNLGANKKGQVSFSATLGSAHKRFEVKKVDANTISLLVQVRNGALHGVSHLRVVAKAGTVSVKDNWLIIANADEATLYLTAATNFKNYKDVSGIPHAISANTMALLKGKTYQQIKQAHVKEYQSYYNTLSIHLPQSHQSALPTDERLNKFAAGSDPSFVGLYMQYSRYLLIASSRPGTHPANLQGIWNDMLAPPWGSKYTTNINAEMNYWPAELLNLSAMHQPFFGMIKELAQSGKETAKDYYNAPGWVLHHNTDLWRGTAPINASNHGIWVTGGAWLCQHLWEHYLYSLDKTFLKQQAYPIMKQAAMFFNHFLVKDPATGYLISTPSNSPEQGGLVAGPTMDHQIIRALFRNVAAAAQLLKVDAAFSRQLLEKASQIAPNRIGRYGQLQEWMQDIDDTTNNHRHISHLWGMYPGNEINYDATPQLMQAAKQSLIYRGDVATGWSLGWKINCWARFKDGDHTFKLLQMLLSPAQGGAGSYPNLFDAHPPFQIDGNFGGAAGIGEMLLQSHAGYIDLLPALPASLPEGEVKGLCARGGFVIDMTWKHGALVSLTVHAKMPQKLTIKYQSFQQTISTAKNQVLYFDGKLNRK